MAQRPTVLFLGDLTAAGNRPVSELAAINGTYDDPQADCSIWNIAAQAWQTLTPGTNTNTNAGGSDRWSFESRFREAIRSQKPTGTYWVLKYAVASQMLQTGVNPSWTPGYAGNALAGFVTQLQNAASAAVLAGDTLRVDAIVVSIQTDDFRQSYWKMAGGGFQLLIDYLRNLIATTANVAAGSIRGDNQKTPVVFVEHHYKYVVSDAEKASLTFSRMVLQGLESEIDRIRTVRAHATTSADNITFSAGSMVALAADIGAAMFAPVAYDDASNAEARVGLLISDSILEGTGNWLYPGTGGAPNNLPPSHQQAAMTGARVWNPFAGEFQTLAYGVNNQISMPSFLGGFGCELSLADEFLTNGDFWLVKSTCSGTFASQFNSQRPGGSINLGFDLYLTSWSPTARLQLFDLAVRGWFRSAIDNIRRGFLKKPRVEVVAICMGTNDLTYLGSNTGDVGTTVRSIIDNVLRVLTDLNITHKPRFVVCVPNSDLVNDSRVVADQLNEVREALLALPSAITKVSTLDLSQFATVEHIHPLSADNTEIGKTIYGIWEQDTEIVVQPLFMPSIDELKQALRLSQVPDDNDAIHQIDIAVQTVGVNFQAELGEARVTALKSYPFSKNPENNGEFLRVLAAVTEVKWVRMELLRVLPTMFMDGSKPIQSWKDEAAFREGSFLQTQNELKRLSDEIKQNLKVLQDSMLTAPGSISVEIVSPCSSIVPGQTTSMVF